MTTPPTSPSPSGDAPRALDRGLTAELIARHDRPGPRYTSYPTAVEFHEGVGAADYERHLARANAVGDEPLSTYLHLPFCEHRCLFCGCHVIITPHKERAAPYVDLLRREIELVADRLPARRGIGQLHLGGGTPTYHEPAQLAGLLDAFFEHFERLPDAELAIEVDPRVTRLEHLDVLAERGFNRISLGVQDFTSRVQEAIEREQSVDETRAIVEGARQRGFRGVNIDLIYGLPHQERASFERTVELVIDMGVDRVAVYSFAFVPWIRGQQKYIAEEDLPPRDEKIALFALARERFLDAGYVPIGMDHFARPDDELALARNEGRLRRNFQGYTVIPASDVVGFGISAIGDVRGGYFQNRKKLSDYTAAIEEERLPVMRGVLLSPDDELRRAVIHELMCNGRVEFAPIEQRFGVRFEETFAEDLRRLRAYEAESMVRVLPDRIEATDVGQLFVRNLAMCFDRYWREKHEGGDRPVFSRTV